MVLFIGLKLCLGRTFEKLCLSRPSSRIEFLARRCEAELRGSAFPSSGAWER